MSYPLFSKSGLSNLVFSRGIIYPEELIYTPRQLVGISEAGAVRVATLGAPEQLLPLVFERIPTADIEALVAWFQHTLINWSAHAFTYVDSAAFPWSVRYAGGPFVKQKVGYGLYTARIPLRRELV